MSSKKEAYLCLSAVVSARETKLLTNEKAERMLDAPGFEDAAKLLSECGYPDMSRSDAAAVEECLDQHREEVFDEMSKACPDKSLVDIFRLRYDYHNAKAILKSEAMGLDAKRLLSGSGRVSGEKLMEAYQEEKTVEKLEKLGEAMAEAKSVLARTANPQLSDFVLDKAYFDELSAIADELDNSFVRGYVTALIDAANLKSTVRTLRLGKGQEFLRQVLIPGGSVDPDRLEAAGDRESLAAPFACTLLEKAAQLGGEALSGGSMTAFELACDNAVNAYLKNAKLICCGCEPVLGYLSAVEGEITAVRMILTGRLAGIAPQVIRERLRDLYA